MKKTINSNHYLALAVSAGIFVASILAFIFMYYQVGVQIDNTASSYGQMAQIQAQQSQAQSIVQDLSTTQSQRSLLQSFFVHDDQTVNFITQVENAGPQSGGSKVSIASISDDDLSSAAVGATGSIHAHIEITGSWMDAMRALHVVESLPYGEEIDNVRATPVSSTDWSIGFDLTAVLIHE